MRRYFLFFRFLIVSIIFFNIALFSLVPIASGVSIYNEMIEQAHGKAKPAHLKKEEENPVLVTYQVGDTSSFIVKPDTPLNADEQSEWDEWDEDYDEDW